MSYPPSLNRKLELQERQLSPDGAGGFDVAWQTLGTIYGAVEARRGAERRIGGRIVPSVAYVITTRAAPVGSPSRPKTDQRLLDGGRIYSVLAVAEHDANGLYLDIWAEEGSENG